jgi:predicted DNA-binding transcriptional regulator YafY
MSNDVSLLRQWLLLKTLCSRHQGVTVQAMAAELEVAEKTIRRDLATFASVGFPLEESVGPRGQKSWKIATSPAGRPDLAFSLDEVLALYLARRFLEPLAGTVIWTAALSAFRKVRASLSRAALD